METDNKKSLFSGDLAITALVGATAAYMLVASSPFRLLGRLFPQAIAGLTLLACILQAIISIRKSRREGGKTGKATEKRQHLAVAAVALIYLVLLPFLGFIISTVALTVYLPFRLGHTNKAVVVAVGVILTLVFYAVFRTFFYVPLPRGILTFI